MPSRPIRRPRHLAALVSALGHNPECALLGPRQCGKTTLARQLAAGRRDVHLFDLETAAGRARLAQPELALEPLAGLVIIDEVQRQPGLFEVIRPLADRPGTPARFLILGSASPELVSGVSESLAGRVGVRGSGWVRLLRGWTAPLAEALGAGRVSTLLPGKERRAQSQVAP